MKQDKTELVFGAMLHDIGKVVYRSEAKQVTHSKLGADFVANNVALINTSFSEEEGRRIIEQIQFHHLDEMMEEPGLSDDSLAWVTCFANSISTNMHNDNEGSSVQPTTLDKNTELRRIFNTLNGRNDDNTFEHEDYSSIRKRILEGLADIDLSWQGIGSLMNLLETTIDTIPASIGLGGLTDVSLFDHAKTTAGIATCVYEYLQGQGHTNYRQTLFGEEDTSNILEEPMFLLFSCDMSGIQSFIYNISGEGALKQLRARSFYLEMMLEHIADELLDSIGLSRANLLYTGGGHAYLLLPNTEDIEQTLTNFIDELQNWFIETYRTDLFLAATWVECSANDLANHGEDKQRYREVYRKLAAKLSTVKASRYSAARIIDLNFGSTHSIDHSRECTECHRADSHINSQRKCKLCAALGSISREIILKDIFVVRAAQDSESEASRNRLLLPFGKELMVFTEQEYYDSNTNAERVYAKNLRKVGIKPVTFIWMGDYTAGIADQSFSDFSTYSSSGATLNEVKGDKKLGIDRLGVLRADVDNLGVVFTDGLPDEKISVSRTTTLSRKLSYFFKTQVNEILKASNYQVQVIYSGGDDLFIVGNWSDVIYAAIDIRKALDEFTGNGVLTISAGIGMYNSKYPISRMAYEVGELEDAAKRYPHEAATPTKNALAIWSKQSVFNWSEFIEVIMPRMDEIKQDFWNNEKGNSLVYRLIGLLRDRDPISIPRLAYLLARSFEDKKEQGVGIAHKYYQWALDDKERRYFAIALEWYVYSIREKG